MKQIIIQTGTFSDMIEIIEIAEKKGFKYETVDLKEMCCERCVMMDSSGSKVICAENRLVIHDIEKQPYWCPLLHKS